MFATEYQWSFKI